MKEIYEGMGKFSTEVFHDSTSVGHLMKLKIEADEAIEQPDDIFEYADCMLALFASIYKAGFTFDDITKASKEKLEILKTRTWGINDDGMYQHI